MSGPSAESVSSSAPTSAATAPSSGGGLAIVLVASGLMVLAALVAFLVLVGGKGVDGAALLSERLGVRDVGANYAIVESREVPFGSRLVVLEDASQPEPTGSAAAAAPAETASDAPKFDWKAVSIPTTTTGPRRLVFVFPSDTQRGHESVADTLRTISWTDLDDLGPEGGRVLVARDTLAWRGYDAAWVHVREFERGGAFRDSMQVDLSTASAPCLLTATWPRGVGASRDAFVALLDRLGAKRAP